MVSLLLMFTKKYSVQTASETGYWVTFLHPKFCDYVINTNDKRVLEVKVIQAPHSDL